MQACIHAYMDAYIHRHINTYIRILHDVCIMDHEQCEITSTINNPKVATCSMGLTFLSPRALSLRPEEVPSIEV